MGAMTESILVFQSANAAAQTGWQGRCMASVREWATHNGYGYRCVGDELFDCVPDWYLEKVGDRLAIAADYARLVWMHGLLHPETEAAQGLVGQFRGSRQAPMPSHVVWLDADVLVFAPERFALDVPEDCSFGREHWLAWKQANQPQDGLATLNDAATRGLRQLLGVRKNVHNALAMFARGSATLPFLAATVLRLMERVDPAHIAPQFVGPKLLTSLHNTVGFEVTDSVGAISPLLAAAIVEKRTSIVDFYSTHLNERMCAANLCASLLASDLAREQGESEQVVANRLIDALVGDYTQGIG